MVIGVLHNMKVKCDLFRHKIKHDLLHRKKIIFLDARSHFSFTSTLVIGVLYDMKVKCNLMRQINIRHLVRRKWTFDAYTK